MSNSAEHLVVSRRLTYAAWLLLLGVLLSALCAKIILFRGLAYTSDLFNAVQSAKSFIQGRAPFFANDLGRQLSYSHNHFLLIVLSPAIWLFGAYPFFVVSILLLALAGALSISCAYSNRTNSNRYLMLLAPFILLCSPITFWLFDDQLYGWHVEFLFVPLGFLFTLSLLNKSSWAWIWAGLMVLTKEDGAVVACCLHLGVYAANALYDSNSSGFSGLLNRRVVLRLARIAASWLGLFAAGLIILSVLSGGARLSGSAQAILAPIADPKIVPATIEMFSDIGLLIASTILPILILVRGRYLVVLLIALLPCILVGYVSIASYASDSASYAAHGLTWPARFALIWAVFGGVVLCAALRPLTNFRIGSPFFATKIFGGILAIWLIQDMALYQAINYKFLHRASVLFYPSRDILPGESLNSREHALLRCLAKLLPTSCAIGTEPMLYGYFHNHDVASADFDDGAWLKPEVIVCESRKRLATSHTCQDVIAKSDPQNFSHKSFEGIEVGYHSKFQEPVLNCLSQARGVG